MINHVQQMEGIPVDLLYIAALEGMYSRPSRADDSTLQKKAGCGHPKNDSSLDLLWPGDTIWMVSYHGQISGWSYHPHRSFGR